MSSWEVEHAFYRGYGRGCNGGLLLCPGIRLLRATDVVTLFLRRSKQTGFLPRIPRMGVTTQPSGYWAKNGVLRGSGRSPDPRSTPFFAFPFPTGLSSSVRSAVSATPFATFAADSSRPTTPVAGRNRMPVHIVHVLFRRNPPIYGILLAVRTCKTFDPLHFSRRSSTPSP